MKPSLPRPPAPQMRRHDAMADLVDAALSGAMAGAARQDLTRTGDIVAPTIRETPAQQLRDESARFRHTRAQNDQRARRESIAMNEVVELGIAARVTDEQVLAASKLNKHDRREYWHRVMKGLCVGA